MQDDVKEQRMTNEEAKAKLELFEKLFSKGCYFCARIVADELYDADIDSARGYAMVCARAYEPYHRILKEKGEKERIRVNNIFMKYHFSYWSLPTNTKREGIKDGTRINKFKNERSQE
ncbi:MAG: hypothetical protein PHY59_09715 [Methanobacterium sp.]|nr:hypothetical protein [Methanobacterium sp.]